MVVMNLHFILVKNRFLPPKSNWKPPVDHNIQEYFLNQIEKQLFELKKTSLGYPVFIRKSRRQ